MNEEKDKIKIIVTGGGTAGHVMPIISISEEIRKLEPRAVVRFIGQRGDERSKLLVKSCSAIDESYSISAGKLRRFHGRSFFWYLAHPTIIFKNIIDIFKLILGIAQSLIILIRWRPNVVFVKGGFVGLPVGLASALLKIKIVTHDSDAVPGLTNRILSRFVYQSAVALPVKYYGKYYKASTTVQTGVPIHEKYFMSQPIDKIKLKMRIPVDNKVLCVIGGSLGAVRMNNAVLDILPGLLVKHPNLNIVWSTGELQNKELNEAIEKLGLKSKVYINSFFSNLDEIFGISDLVISRAGATTIAELAAAKKPCIFVPNPVLTGGHQSKNADILNKNDAAVIIKEKDLEKSSERLLLTINQLLGDKNQLIKLGNNLSNFADQSSTSKLARLILEVAK